MSATGATGVTDKLVWVLALPMAIVKSAWWWLFGLKVQILLDTGHVVTIRCYEFNVVQGGASHKRWSYERSFLQKVGVMPRSGLVSLDPAHIVGVVHGCRVQAGGGR